MKRLTAKLGDVAAQHGAVELTPTEGDDMAAIEQAIDSTREDLRRKADVESETRTEVLRTVEWALERLAHHLTTEPAVADADAGDSDNDGDADGDNADDGEPKAKRGRIETGVPGDW